MANINPFNCILLAINHDSAFPHILLTLKFNVTHLHLVHMLERTTLLSLLDRRQIFFFTGFHKHPHLKPQDGSLNAFFGVTLSQKEVVVVKQHNLDSLQQREKKKSYLCSECMIRCHVLPDNEM